jgi:DNA polymerase III epsilon subunit-like protein
MPRTRSRDEQRSWGRRTLAGWACRDDWVALDTETTGNGDVIEVAVVRADGAVLVDTLVHSPQPITPGAASVHGIPKADVEAAPHWPSVWPALADALAGRPVLAYNASFDRSRLAGSVARRGGALDAFQGKGQAAGGALTPEAWIAGLAWADVMEPVACAAGDWSAYHGSFTWMSLEDAARRREVDPPELHRARGDAETVRRLIRTWAGTTP